MSRAVFGRRVSEKLEAETAGDGDVHTKHKFCKDETMASGKLQLVRLVAPQATR